MTKNAINNLIYYLSVGYFRLCSYAMSLKARAMCRFSHGWRAFNSV